MKRLKRLFLSLFSFFLAGFLFWLCMLLNPSLLYAHATAIESVTVHHNFPLPPESEAIVKQALQRLQQADLFHPDQQFDLCLNEESMYPELFPLKGGVAYAFLNKAVIYRCVLDWEAGKAHWEWEENEGEIRFWRLEDLLAHEMVHCLQSRQNRLFPLQVPTWKIEGYAEYFSRPQTLSLHQKYELLSQPQSGKHIPWIRFADGTGTPHTYWEMACVVGFLVEEKGYTYADLLADTTAFPAHMRSLQQWATNDQAP